jgi:hypothetical protein
MGLGVFDFGGGRSCEGRGAGQQAGRLLLRVSETRFPWLSLSRMVTQPRSGPDSRWSLSVGDERKVRAPQDRVVGNSDRPRG